MDDAPTNISVIPSDPYSTLGAGIHIETKEMLIIGHYKSPPCVPRKPEPFRSIYPYRADGGEYFPCTPDRDISQEMRRRYKSGNLRGQTTFLWLCSSRSPYHPPEISFSTFVRSPRIILVYVLGNGLDVIINMGIKMLSSLSMKAPALHNVPRCGIGR